MKGLLYLGAVVVSAVTTFFVTKAVLETKYEKLCQKECDDYRAYVKEHILKSDNLEAHDRKVRRETIDIFVKELYDRECYDPDFLIGIANLGYILFPTEEEYKKQKEEEVLDSYTVPEGEAPDEDTLKELVRMYNKNRGISFDDEGSNDEKTPEDIMEQVNGREEPKRPRDVKPRRVSETVAEHFEYEEDFEDVWMKYNHAEDILFDMEGNRVDPDDLRWTSDLFDDINPETDEHIYIIDESTGLCYVIEVF